MAARTYNIFANGEHLGQYTVPASWGFNRISTRMHRVALVAMGGKLQSVVFSSK